MSVGSVGPSKIGSRKSGDFIARVVVARDVAGRDDGSAARMTDGIATADASAIDPILRKSRRLVGAFIRGAPFAPAPARGLSLRRRGGRRAFRQLQPHVVVLDA